MRSFKVACTATTQIPVPDLSNNGVRNVRSKEDARGMQRMKLHAAAMNFWT